MKTAISIPDDLFADAEELARELKKSRSRLYGDAVREYVARHSAESITESLDRRLRRGRVPQRLRWRRRAPHLRAQRLVTAQGEVWWADLAEPGSEPGFRRPVVVVQGDAFNRSRIATVVCVALTSNLRWASSGQRPSRARATGLPKDSVANVSQLVTLDREALTERVGALPAKKLDLVLLGIDVVLGRLTHCGRITRAGSLHARRVLVEAAHVAVRLPGPLRDRYLARARRRGKKVALVAAARELLELSWTLLDRGEVYRAAA